MSIEYPLILPTTPGLRSAEFRPRQICGISPSPFTGQQSGGVYEWSGEWWEVDCSVPPMARAAAEEWLATLIALRGGAGTFLLGDRGGNAPRGSGAGYPSVDGDSQLGKTLATLGWNPSSSAVLKKGDYLQIAKNYEPYPRAFDNAHWGKTECTVAADTIVAPNGGTEAERGTPNSGATSAYLQSDLSTVPARFKNLTWYFSVWLKAAVGTPAIFIAITDGVSETLQNCNLTTTWQRFVANRTISGNATWFRISVGGANSWPEADGPIDMWGAAVYCPTLDARLHKILIEAASDANGKAALDIWPRLRESPPDFSALVLTDAKGTFRLREPPGWTLDEMLHYGISFKAMEAF